jgi:hypothetical protein
MGKQAYQHSPPLGGLGLKVIQAVGCIVTKIARITIDD